MTGSQVRTVNVARAMKEDETMIVGAGIVIGTMIETVDMTETGIETWIAAPMIQEVVGGHAHVLESDLEIMIVIGTSSLVSLDYLPDFFFSQCFFLQVRRGIQKE